MIRRGPPGPPGGRGSRGATGPAGAGADPVNSISQGVAGSGRLVDIDTTDLDTGTLRIVATVLDGFVLDKSSTLTADGITIVQPLVGSGRWLRLSWGNVKWRSQASWFIDPANGNDENDGSSLAPIKSHKEFVRRLGQGDVEITMDVQLLSNTPAADRVFLQGVNFGKDAVLRYHGTPTTVYSGTISAVTALNSATQTPPTISDAAMPDFATHIGRRIRLTSGPNAGAVGWLTKKISNTEARTSQMGLNDVTAVPYQPDVTLVTPSVGETYVIETLPTIASMEIDCSRPQSDSGTTVLFDSLRVGWADGSRFSSHMLNIAATKCEWNARLLFGRQMQMSLVRWNGNEAFAFGQVIDRAGYHRGVFTLRQNAAIEIRDQSVAQECTALVDVLANCFAELFNCSSFDGITDGINCDVGGVIRFTGLFWGNNNTQVGIRCQGHAHYLIKPTCTGLAGDTVIGGTPTAYAGIPLLNATNGATLVAIT